MIMNIDETISRMSSTIKNLDKEEVKSPAEETEDVQKTPALSSARDRAENNEVRSFTILKEREESDIGNADAPDSDLNNILDDWTSGGDCDYFI